MKQRLTTHLLQKDNTFNPSGVQDGNEIYRTGIFKWNITNMENYIATHLEDAEFVWLPVDSFSGNYAKINQEHVPKVDLHKPIIVVELSVRNKNYLIDGHHRVEKAQTEQVTHLPAYKLKVMQHIPFLTSKEGYEAYIDYWNEKARHS